MHDLIQCQAEPDVKPLRGSPLEQLTDHVDGNRNAHVVSRESPKHQPILARCVWIERKIASLPDGDGLNRGFGALPRRRQVGAVACNRHPDCRTRRGHQRYNRVGCERRRVDEPKALRYAGRDRQCGRPAGTVNVQPIFIVRIARRCNLYDVVGGGIETRTCRQHISGPLSPPRSCQTSSMCV